MNRICLIEDCPQTQQLIKRSLENWYEISSAISLKEGLEILAHASFDLILLDVNLPDGSGFDFCNHLKTHNQMKGIPVIFLTGKDKPTDKMLGFSLGAADYITKPFEPIEMRARIEARIKNSINEKASPQIEIYGAIKFDRVKQRAFSLPMTILDGNQETDLNLTPFEFKLIYFLASNEGTVFKKDILLKQIQEAGVHVNHENIYTHISALRKKLGSLADAVECIPRVGYRFNSRQLKAA